jgi:hypothetical protein
MTDAVDAQATPSPPAGWYPDPSGEHASRYWDGATWTDQTTDAAPAAPAAPPAPVAERAVECTDLFVRLSVDEARDAVCEELARMGFRLTFSDAFNGVAERGSKGMNVAFGAMAQYFRIPFQLFGGPEGQTVIRLMRAHTGYWTGGGLVGRARVSGAFKQISNDLIQGLTARGVLADVAHL